jgi:hypothetical protein
MKSAVWSGPPRTLVVAHGTAFPTDEEWDRHVAIADELRASLAPADPFRVLVLSDGGGPTSAQRARLSERPVRGAVLAAVVTASTLATQIGRVMGLLYPGVRVFPPRDVARALAYLEIGLDAVPGLVAHLGAIDAGAGLAGLAELQAIVEPRPT